MNKFKVSDKVYYPPLNTKIFTLEPCKLNGYPLAIDGCVAFNKNGIGTSGVSWLPEIFHATDENHTLLEQLYGVEFEAPSSPKAPQEVIQAMLDDGWIGVTCYVNDIDKKPSKYNKKDFITMIKDDVYDGYIFNGNTYNWKYANPFDPKTGKIIIDYIDGEMVLEG